MHLNLKPYYIALVVLILCFILVGVVGNAVVPGGMENLEKKYVGYMKVLVFSLFFLCCMTLVPMGIKSFLVGQYKIGNDSLPMVKLLNDNIYTFIFCIWGIFLAGMLIAIPYMIKDGFFGE